MWISNAKQRFLYFYCINFLLGLEKKEILGYNKMDILPGGIMMRKVLLVVLSWMLLLSLSFACAEGTSTDGTASDFKYVYLADQTISITAYVGSQKEVVIPSMLMGVRVTSIGAGAFADHAQLTSVTIPDSVTDVGANPFRGCTRLTNIRVSATHPTLLASGAILMNKVEQRLICYSASLTETSYAIPETIQEIGDYAFYNCDALKSVTIPDTVTYLGNGAFADCDGLKEISLPNSLIEVGSNPFYCCQLLEDIHVLSDHPTLATVNGVLFDKLQRRLVCYPYAFTDGEYAILNGIQIIDAYAFFGCKFLTSVTIPTSVTTIGEHAFDSCFALGNVSLSENVTSMGEDVFANCASLTEIQVIYDSYAHHYCQDNKLPCSYDSALDWLTNW